MITGFLLTILTALFSAFIAVLPVVAMPTEWLDAITLVWGYINAFSWLFPIDTFASVISFAIVFHLALFTYDVSLKIYHMIRG